MFGKNKYLNLKNIKKLGYDAEELGNRIFLINNFISEDQLNRILHIARTASEEEWSHHYMDGVRSIAKLKFGRSDLENLVKEGLYEITSNWSDKNLYIKDEILRDELNKKCQELFKFNDNLEFPGCGTIQRQYEGVPLTDHVDNHTDPSLEYALVIYLNEDYSDGEFFFVNKDIEFRPPSRSALVFPTSEEWRHGVRSVGEGPHRYVIPIFIRRKNFWEKHKENNYNVDKTLSETSY